MSQRKPFAAWYNSGAWRKRRAYQLDAAPLCNRCLSRGVVTPATVANHNPPHRGDWQAFMNGPLESLCAPCHDITAQREEKRGYAIGHDIDGRPIAARRGWRGV